MGKHEAIWENTPQRNTYFANDFQFSKNKKIPNKKKTIWDEKNSKHKIFISLER